MEFRSKRLGQIPPYVFAEFNKRKAALIQAGVDIIDLGIGDPDLPTPAPIVDKLVEESDVGHCRWIRSVSASLESTHPSLNHASP